CRETSLRACETYRNGIENPTRGRVSFTQAPRPCARGSLVLRIDSVYPWRGYVVPPIQTLPGVGCFVTVAIPRVVKLAVICA
ncbi:MAG: hypothetical protein QGD93_12185, partial [Actinomycetota bacterium]|nr:hypothetical protein [Actinomycetota bacterium]